MPNPSTVWFVPPQRVREGIGTILEESGFLASLRSKKKLGIKVHFGERGNSNHLRPELVRAVAVSASYHNLQPVVIETTALYRGPRQQAASHIAVAREHGFSLSTVLAPIEIVDGDLGDSFYEVPLNSTLVPRAKLARGIRRLRYIVNLAHFKGHFVTGFGGVIKNLAMGLAAKAGKLEMHSNSRPYVEPQRCTSCGICVDYCPRQAINFVDSVARIGRSCSGCGGCLAICPHGAIAIDWNAASESVQRKMVEYARAVLFNRRIFHFNVCLRVTPNCDCYPQTEKPLTADVGLFGSHDPVACEQAAWNSVGEKLRNVHPHIQPTLILEAAEQAGLGTRHHQLVEL